MSIVLEGSKEDEEKWKRFSRQIVDVVFPQLSKLQVIDFYGVRIGTSERRCVEY